MNHECTRTPVAKVNLIEKQWNLTYGKAASRLNAA